MSLPATVEFIPNASSDTPLAASASFTSPWIESQHSEMIIAFTADQTATYKAQFSTTEDGSDIDSTLTYTFTPGSVETPKRLVIARKYFRVVVTNSASSAMTEMRLQVGVGSFPPLTSPLNGTVTKDGDSTVVRSLSADIEIAAQKYQGFQVVNKFGENGDIDTGTVPEDIWQGGGVYTGFPTGSAELVTLVSSDVNDDEGGSGAEKVRIYGLDANGVEQNELITLNGTTSVDSANTYTRIFRGIVEQSANGANTATNVGTITCAHKVTTANVFFVMPATRNQTQVCAYTIPADSIGLLKFFNVRIDKTQTANAEGYLWIRENGKPQDLLGHLL